MLTCMRQIDDVIAILRRHLFAYKHDLENICPRRYVSVLFIPFNDDFLDSFPFFFFFNLNCADVMWAIRYFHITTVGHNFGASHSFEDGQGQTGGIMDYSDGFYNGVIQARLIIIYSKPINDNRGQHLANSRTLMGVRRPFHSGVCARPYQRSCGSR